MSKLLIFKSFSNKEEALRTAATLENNGIQVDLEENLAQLDSNFIGQHYSNPYCIKIPGDSFEKASEILMKYTVINLDEVDKDYMLLSFSNEELMDVLVHNDDWGIYNYKLAEALLKERGIDIPFKKIEEAQAEAREAIAKPIKYDIYWLILGYIFALLSFSTLYAGFLFAFPTLCALIIGYLLFFSKKTLTDGSRIKTYERTFRIHGLIIFVLTIIVSLVRLVLLYSSNQ